MNRRIEILSAAINLKGFGGSSNNFLWNLLAPPAHILGSRRIQRVGPGPANTTAIWIKGYSRPLFLPNEFPIRCIHQPLAEETYPRNWHYYCIPETSVNGDDTILDCGAAEGLFSFLARQKGASCVAFEPHPIYFRALQQTFAHDDKITLINSALGETSGMMFLSEGDVASKVNPDGGHPVRIETIDDVCGRLQIAPTYLKADVEGFESNLLQGAAETITRHHPKIAITTYHVENDANTLSSMLKRYWPKYRIRIKGISNRYGKPVMLHAW